MAIHPRLPHNFKPLIMPIILVVVYLVFSYLLKDILPTTAEVIDGFEKLFRKYGYEIIFFGAFFEAALIIDFFIPGSSIVLAGAYFSFRGLMPYPIFWLVAAAGFFFGFILDYLIGLYGWSDILRKFGLGKELDKVHAKVERMGGKAFFIGYVHPDLASLFAVSAGILKMNIKHFVFYNLAAGSFWLFFWTGLVYIFGNQIQQILENNTGLVFLFVPLIILVLWLVRKI